MPENYRKHGRSVRYENGTLVLASESGEAIEDGPLFTCRPLRAARLPEIDSQPVSEAVHRIRNVVGSSVAVERLVVSEGVAEHEFGDVSWSERHRRVHMSLVRGTLRALVDLATFDLGVIEIVARALADATSESFTSPVRARLAPHVSAALLPALVGVTPPNVQLSQEEGGRDGKGQPVRRHPIAEEPWPNWYRPSYRVRPTRAPFNLLAQCQVASIDEELPRAVALLGPVEGLSMRVLLQERKRVYPAVVRVSRIDAIGRETLFFPYGAGSFGAEMML